MQIRFVGRFHRKLLIKLRQISFQELVCCLDRADTQQPHLLYQPILKGLEKPLNAALGLRRVCIYHPTSNSAMALPNSLKGLTPAISSSIVTLVGDLYVVCLSR